MKLVVVESPAKAKTINKYLGKDFLVVASYGHVRDLPPKDGSVRPDEDFAMSWEVDGGSEKHIREIAKAAKGAEHVYLATDPDREGEAISWHVLELLKERKALGRGDVKRVVFNEITKDAVLDAMRHPREVNKELVEAYLARRALDYLVGFSLSPVLWRKLPGSRSAGRVQSVALRLVCEREAEIERFDPREYWTVDVDFLTPSRAPLTARLTHLDGKKLEKFDLGDKAKADAAVRAIEGGDYSVLKVERKETRRHPQPPFTTSTLQQEASRKLGFGASRTMRAAQRLYEGVDLGGETVGLITYMRTDSVALAGEAIGGARRLIEQQYGTNYLPAEPRRYKTTAKNAQEAHEAIRPTDVGRRPQDVAAHLDGDLRRLYELIWLRTVASQMESARLDQVAIDIGDKAGKAALRATGAVLLFDGFLRVYQEGRDDPADEEEAERRLPQVKPGEALERGAVKPEQHFTQPPPRFSEASLVKRLEELGIGRPSTYASILQVLQDRKYVRLEKSRFIPEDRGRIVTAFLVSFFERYVEYNFTAELEGQLDDVSDGRIDWKALLRKFWDSFGKAVESTKDLSMKAGHRRAQRGARALISFPRAPTAATRAPARFAARASSASSSAASAPSSAARTTRNAAIRARSRSAPTARAAWRRPRTGRASSAPTPQAACRSRCAWGRTGITCSSARAGTARKAARLPPRPNPSASRCRAAPRPSPSISSWRSSCWRCRARSAFIRRAASPSRPGSAASAPISSTRPSIAAWARSRSC